MKAVIQRVARARVTVGERLVAAIDQGFVALIGVASTDTADDARWLADKIAGLRVFGDDEGRMSLGPDDVGGSVLVISQFTLIADTRKGRRPSFAHAAPPEQGRELYEEVVSGLKEAGVRVATGEFGAHMLVDLTNDGPVTVILDSADRARPRRGG